MRHLRALGGTALLGFGLLILAISVMSVVDPAGMKQADDADPFGPSSRSDGVPPILVGAGFLAGGWLLLRSRSR